LTGIEPILLAKMQRVAFAYSLAIALGDDAVSAMQSWTVSDTAELELDQKITNWMKKKSAMKESTKGPSCIDYPTQFNDCDEEQVFGAVDLDGKGCDSYKRGRIKLCGKRDDGDFLANEMCCSCGGGSTYRGARELAVNRANVFLAGEECPDGFLPVDTVSACRAGMDLLGISGGSWNTTENSEDYPKGCYYCDGDSDCPYGAYFNFHDTGSTVPGTQRMCHKNYNAADVEIFFVGDSDIDYWDSSVTFPGSFNVGIGGYTTMDVTEEIDHWVRDVKPTWVVFVSGENDIKGPDEVDNPRELTDKAFERFKKIVVQFVNTGARVIYLGTKVEPGSHDIFEEYAHYDAQVRALATAMSAGKQEPPFVMIDVFRAFTRKLSRGVAEDSWDQLYNTDGLHMSRLGYKLWNSWLKIAMESPTPCIRWVDGICVEKSTKQ